MTLGLLEDVRRAVRGVRQRLGVSTAVVATIAVGIGVSTATYSVAHSVLLAPLPYPEPDRLTFIWKDFSANYQKGPLSPRELGELRATATQYESIGGIWSVSGTLLGDGEPEPLRIGRVTSNFLDVLGVAPLRGRTLTPEDERDGPPNMIISHDLWQRRFGGSDVLGRRVRIGGGWGFGGNEYTIVGVMPQGFEMLLPDPSVGRFADVWVPFQGEWINGSSSMLRVVARLASDASLAAAQDQVEAVGRSVAPPRRLYAVSLHGELVADARPSLVVLQGAVLLMLLVACISVAGLLLLSAQRRRQEIAIRIALGASPPRIARMILTECLVLAVAGGVLGTLIAYGGVRLLPLLDVGYLPRGNVASLNGAVLAFAMGASLFCGIIFGLAPLRDARRTNVVEVIGDGRRTTGAGFRGRTGFTLLIAEIAFSVVLLVGAGLLTRTFVRLQTFKPGFNGKDVLTFRLALPAERYNAEVAPTFSDDIERAIRAVPGVRAAGGINQLPLDDEPNFGNSFWTRATVSEDGAAPLADARIVTPGFFEAIGAELVEGRGFSRDDAAGHPLALIVDERLAKRAWPGKSAVGQELLLSSRNGEWGQVIGVVRHLRHHRLSDEVREQVYMNYAQRGRSQMSVVIQSSLPAGDLMRAIGARLREIDPDLGPARVQPLKALMDRSTAKARFTMALASLFAAIGLVLAGLSLYGVISYAVRERTRELGIRSALGAERSELMAMVMRQGARLTWLGVALGLGASLLLGRAMGGLLFGVRPFDPLTFIGVPLIVGVTALIACAVPALRAARIDPIIALRGD